MIQRKRINLFLITIAFTIWMFIFYKFILDEKEETHAIMTNTQQELIEHEEPGLSDSIYTRDRLKDPFITPFNKKKEVKKKKNAQKNNKVIPQPPKLELLGILNDQNRAIALVKFPDKSVHFVKISQKIGKIRIVDINDNSIKYTFGKDLYNLVMK